jgi:hypothetical protein
MEAQLGGSGGVRLVRQNFVDQSCRLRTPKIFRWSKLPRRPTSHRLDITCKDFLSCNIILEFYPTIQSAQDHCTQLGADWIAFRLEQRFHLITHWLASAI